MGGAVICQPLRTPVGKYGGSLKDITAVGLAVTVIRGIIARSGIDPELIDDVVLGQCYPNGEAPAIGRVAALDAGLPVSIPGLQVDRRCGSGLQAVIDAVMRVETGAASAVLAGGTESMSQAEHYVLGPRWGLAGSGEFYDRIARGRVTSGGVRYPVAGGMIETAENLRREYQIERRAQDELALQSQQRAERAQERGLFAAEIVSVEAPRSAGITAQVSVDEHPRHGMTLEALAELKPIRRHVDPEATVTAGNASGQNDGAAACLVMTDKLASSLGIRPIARLVSWAAAGVGPERMGIGPVPATKSALLRAGLTFADLDVIELNEAFASQALAVMAEWNMDPSDDRVNPLGSGIALGHPVGATGARMLATMLHELKRRDGTFALETMCIGGGQGLAAVFEAL